MNFEECVLFKKIKIVILMSKFFLGRYIIHRYSLLIIVSFFEVIKHDITYFVNFDFEKRC